MVALPLLLFTWMLGWYSMWHPTWRPSRIVRRIGLGLNLRAVSFPWGRVSRRLVAGMISGLA
jgi:hypothetical protein